MRSLAAILAMAALVAVPDLAAQARQTFAGQIMDSACAMMGGTHDAMTRNNPKLTPKSCTLACVKNGAKFVLYDPMTNTIYQLDDQKKPEKFAGQLVNVSGTLDDATKTIHVASIKMQEISRFPSHGW